MFLGTKMAKHKADGSLYCFPHLLSYPTERLLHQQLKGAGQPAQSETCSVLGEEMGSKESIHMNLTAF